MVLVFILERVHTKVELELKADSYIVLQTSLIDLSEHIQQVFTSSSKVSPFLF